jgi:catechol 2,3-dioxygenase-like lactoylglutathione lyase family enzyme
MDYQLQVVTLSVSDIDKSTAFYTEQAGFTLDVGYHPAPASGSFSSPRPARPAPSRSAGR